MSELWVPSSEGKELSWVCRICKDRFGDQTGLVEHLKGCYDDHADELRELSPRARKFDQMVDPEWHAYNQDLEKRGIDPMRQYDRALKSGVRKLRES